MASEKPDMAVCSHGLLSEMCMQRIPSIVTADLSDRRQYISSTFAVCSFFCESQTLLISSSKAARIINLIFILNKSICSRQTVAHGL